MAEFMRDGQHVWPYCPECGCRLKISTFNAYASEFILNHFGLSPDRDARGCVCSLRYQVQIVPFRKVKGFVGA
jgi:hypothetical protein